MTKEDILENPDNYDLSIETVGKGTLVSPMKGLKFVDDSKRNIEAAARLGINTLWVDSDKDWLPELKAKLAQLD